MMRFDGRTVIVTGGDGGIGGATCHRFAREGARVAVFDLNLDAAERIAVSIRKDGGIGQAFRCDITDRGGVDASVGAAVSRLGPIDVLVNNAGWDVFRPFTKTGPAQWDRLIAINLIGALRDAGDTLGENPEISATRNAARGHTLKAAVAQFRPHLRPYP